MALNLKVRNRTTEANGYRYWGGYYVAESITAGIAPGTLVYVDGNGDVKVADQANDLSAMGIIYNGDVRDIRSAYVDNPDGNAMPRTKGGKSIEMEKGGIIDIVSPDAKTYFRMKDETLTGTVAIAGDTSLTGTGTLFTTELKVGDYVLVDGEVRQIDAITNATTATVSVAFTNTKSTQAIVGKSMKNKPVYLGENGTSTKYGALNAQLGNLTTLKAVASSGDSYQLIGYIDSTKTIRFDLTLQLEIATA